MTLLEAVNLYLRSMGESPVDTIATTHPLVLDILAHLELTSAEVQARAWWFNDRTRTLNVATTGPNVGKVEPPANTELIRPLYSWNQGWTWDLGYLVRLEDDLPQTSAVKAQVRVFVPQAQWLTIPTRVRSYIGYKGARKWAINYEADPLKLQSLAAMEAEAYGLANTDHIRMSAVNLLQQGSVARTMSRDWNYKVRT